MVVLGRFLRDCLAQLMNLLIGNIVARCCGILSDWLEIMGYIDVVVMMLCCSMLLTGISGRGGC